MTEQAHDSAVRPGLCHSPLAPRRPEREEHEALSAEPRAGRAPGREREGRDAHDLGGAVADERHSRAPRREHLRDRLGRKVAYERHVELEVVRRQVGVSVLREVWRRAYE